MKKFLYFWLEGLCLNFRHVIHTYPDIDDIVDISRDTVYSADNKKNQA